MRIDIKQVNGKSYLQYVDLHGHIYHIGSTEKLENWKAAFWLYGYGLNELELGFIHKMKTEVTKHLPGIDEKTWISIEGRIGDGMNGYVGFNPEWKELISRVFDSKAIARDDLRKAVKQKFPEIKSKEALRRTVDYNLKLQRKA